MSTKKKSKKIVSRLNTHEADEYVEDDEELENCLLILGERVALPFEDMIPTVLSNPTSTPVKIELVYIPKMSFADQSAPSIFYTVTARGKRVAWHMSRHELNELGEYMPLESDED